MTTPIDLAEIFRHDENFQSIMLSMLKTVLEASFDGVMITEAGPGYPIVYVNPALCGITGYASHELLGTSPAILQGAQTDQAVLADLKEKLDAGQTFHGQTFNYRKDGSRFVMEWKIVPIKDESGTISHFLAIQREISTGKAHFPSPQDQLVQHFSR